MTARRARESQSIVSGGAALVLTGPWATASVIGLSLLPFAPSQAEIGEKRRKHEERNHRHRDRSALAKLAAGDAALERQGREQVGRIDRPAAGDGVDQLEIGESKDNR